MTQNSEQPKQEYIITEEDILILEDSFGVTLIMPRSRPIIRTSTPAPIKQKFNSKELILFAHDEWKRREERKGNHPECSWVAGFLNGFCTDKKWARGYVDILLKENPS